MAPVRLPTSLKLILSPMWAGHQSWVAQTADHEWYRQIGLSAQLDMMLSLYVQPIPSLARSAIIRTLLPQEES
jgi:hypothetical protein